MKEGRIILPMSGQARLPSADAITKLLEAFGGFTVTQGYGKWRSDSGDIHSDDVRVIDVAYEPEWDNDAKLYDIASTFLQEAKQESVYVRYANGTVQLITAQSCLQNGEKEPFDWEVLRQELHEPADDIGDLVLDEAHHEQA